MCNVTPFSEAVAAVVGALLPPVVVAVAPLAAVVAVVPLLLFDEPQAARAMARRVTTAERANDRLGGCSENRDGMNRLLAWKRVWVRTGTNSVPGSARGVSTRQNWCTPRNS
jgi:hypothetical protein